MLAGTQARTQCHQACVLICNAMHTCLLSNESLYISLLLLLFGYKSSLCHRSLRSRCAEATGCSACGLRAKRTTRDLCDDANL